MEAAGKTTEKPVLSLAAVSVSVWGGYYFGDHCAEKCIFHMNLTGAIALATWIVCTVICGAIGAFIGLKLNQRFIVKKYGG